MIKNLNDSDLISKTKSLVGEEKRIAHDNLFDKPVKAGMAIETLNASWQTRPSRQSAIPAARL